MAFPDIDPIIFQIGPFALRWYAVAYLAGLLLGLAYIKCMASKFKLNIPADDLGDLLTWVVFGVILGGRLGYVLFYQPAYYFENPLQILQVWKGGMSFHGGFLGVTVSVFLFARLKGIKILQLLDLVSTAAPLGLFFGRIANFINGELFGRVTDVPWAIVFPRGGPVARHPSQIYEAALEGLLLFAILNVLVRIPSVRNRLGMLTGVFLIGYALARMTAELFREPDSYLGFFFAGTTMGQLLSIPMLVAGLAFVFFAKSKEVDEKMESSI